MTAPRNDNVDLTTTGATEVGQAGASGGTYQVVAVNHSGTDATITLATNSATATIANAGTLVSGFTLPGTGEPLILTGVVLTASEYVNAQAGTANAIAVSLMGYDV